MCISSSVNFFLVLVFHEYFGKQKYPILHQLSFFLPSNGSNYLLSLENTWQGVAQRSLPTPFSLGTHFRLSFSPINFSRHICSFLTWTVLSVFTGLSPVFHYFTSLPFVNDDEEENDDGGDVDVRGVANLQYLSSSSFC